MRAGAGQGAPRRAELLEEIRKAQEKRADARHDWADDVIDKEDWLDIRQRTDDRIARARKEYDRLSGHGPCWATTSVRHGARSWEDWNTDRKRAAVKAVLNAVTVYPTDARSGGPNWRRELMLCYIADRTQFDWRF